MLQNFGLRDANIVSTSADGDVKLVKDDQVTKLAKNKEYQFIVGCLL